MHIPLIYSGLHHFVCNVFADMPSSGTAAWAPRSSSDWFPPILGFSGRYVTFRGLFDDSQDSLLPLVTKIYSQNLLPCGLS